MKARAGYWIVGSLGIGGLILSLIYCFQGIDWKGSFLGAILSMLLFIVGVQGIENKEP
jgi:hypothetical protein